MFNGFCSSECPPAAYPLANFTCALCPAQCGNCTSPAVCQSCRAPFFLYNFTCLQDCPDGFYKDNLVCRQCSNPCLTCTSATACLSCTSLSFFNGTCVPNCPSRFYPEIGTALGRNVSVCASCILPCVTCSSRTECLSCRSGLQLFGNICQPACPDLYY